MASYGRRTVLKALSHHVVITEVDTDLRSQILTSVSLSVCFITLSCKEKIWNFKRNCNTRFAFAFAFTRSNSIFTTVSCIPQLTFLKTFLAYSSRSEVNMLNASSRRLSSSARLAVQNFTSQWFLIPQGTGITAVILHQLKYQFYGLQVITDVFWILTIAFLLLFLLVYTLRIVFHAKLVAAALREDVQELACLSSVSITFTTIIMMIALTIVRDWSTRWGVVAFVLWWVNVAMASLCCIGLPYLVVRRMTSKPAEFSPSTFLPLIAALTAAAGGGVICRYGALTVAQQIPVIVVSYLLIGMALPLSLVFDSIFIYRCLEGNFPVQQQTYQIALLIGPLGQGSFALQILGEAVLRGSFATWNSGTFLTRSSADSVAFASQAAGLLCWGYGTFWWAFTTISLFQNGVSHFQQHGLRNFKFKLSAWSMVFPLVCSFRSSRNGCARLADIWKGVYTNAAIQLATIMNSSAFSIWSTVLASSLFTIWVGCAAGTLQGVISTRLLKLRNR
jgi:tellurite resistance protein TehA-like permease